MGKYLLVIGIALAVLAVFVRSVSAQPTANPDQVAEARGLLSQFPDGGPGLRAAVARAVETNPSLAVAVSLTARTANEGQQRALGAGLADAAEFFAKLGSSWALSALRQIQVALTLAPPGLVGSFTFTAGPEVARFFVAFPPDLPVTTNHCVSPSAPGARC